MIFNVETLTAATWLCGLEPNVSLDLREAIQSYFPVFSGTRLPNGGTCASKQAKQ